MSNNPQDVVHRPWSDPFVLLCEGDRAGYEAHLLALFRDNMLKNNPPVQVWPCGTSEGLFAMADAIGRTVRVVVIEDRDFRSVEQAKADSAAKLADREGRNIAMRGWTTWRRNEIENYFLDAEVLIPAMSEVFDCPAKEIENALGRAIKALVVFQAVKSAAAAVDPAWSEVVKMRYPGGGRPKWKAEGLVTPKIAEVRSNLQRHINDLQNKVNKEEQHQEPFVGQKLLSEFDSCISEWNDAQVQVETWRSFWAGKEILKAVRQILASKFHPPIASEGRRIPPVEWHKIEEGKKSDIIRDAQDALDRDIERAIQPVMVGYLWKHIETTPTADLSLDFKDLAKLFIW